MDLVHQGRSPQAVMSHHGIHLFYDRNSVLQAANARNTGGDLAGHLRVRMLWSPLNRDRLPAQDKYEAASGVRTEDRGERR